MSCFIVNKDCIGRILFGLSSNPHDCDLVDLADASSKSLSQLGAKMVRMNHEAFGERYPDLGEENAVSEGPPFPVVPCSKVQQLKSLECFLHQCHEGDVMEKKLYKQLRKLAGEWALSIVHQSTQYDAATWG